MTKFCTECGFENLDIARFCRHCGKSFDDEEDISSIDDSHNSLSKNKNSLQIPQLYKDYTVTDETQCINCGENTFTHLYIESFFTDRWVYFCTHCGLTLEKEGAGFKLIDIFDKNNRMWTLYGSKTLTKPEWERIANGGFSNEDQTENDEISPMKNQRKLKPQHETSSATSRPVVLPGGAPAIYNNEITQKSTKLRQSPSQPKSDIEKFIQELSMGRIQLKPMNSPVILKKNEEAYFSIPNVGLGEPYTKRVPQGVGADPSFRVDGVAIPTSGALSKSTQIEVKGIDIGTFVITNKRLIFIGSKKSVNINLNKIIFIEEFRNGISIQRENKQKIEYFVGTNKSSMDFTIEGRKYSKNLEGDLVKAIILGQISKLK